MNRSRRLLLATVGTLSSALVLTPSLSQGAVTSAATASAARAGLAASAADALAAPALELHDHTAFDSRLSAARVAPTAAQVAAARALGARVTWNATGTPRTLSLGSGGALSAPSDAAPVEVARGWLRSQTGLLGLSAADVDALEVVRDHRLPGGVATVVSFAQTFDGVVAGLGGVLTVVVDRDGRVASYSGDPVRETGLLGSFDLTAADALRGVLGDLLPGVDLGVSDTGEERGGYRVLTALDGIDQYVRRIAFPTAAGGRAAYAVLTVKSADEAWATIVDATSGTPLYRKSLVAHADGTVYDNYPGAPRGGKPRTVSFDATPQSPGGYLDPTGAVGLPGVTLLGNNADTAKAWTVPLVAADQYNRTIAPTGSFDFAFPDSWASTGGATGSFVADADAASVNLFYHHNRFHDELYEFGFTETGGNFQVVNAGPASEAPGLGGDPIVGGAQSGAVGGAPPVSLGRNNANMLTLPDGIPGFTNMYLWEPVDDAFEGEPRDGDFDASIIIHEYAHGLSNRYVGGGGLGSLGSGQSGAMGEGWGDWYAMNHLFREGHSRTAVVAGYVGDPDRGIRNWNYAKSPATYGDYGYDMSGPEVHSDGEIWTATLWTLRTEILRGVGGDQRKASDVAEHLVTDAMPLAPATPSFLDMRDAILEAAELRYGKRWTATVWRAFAKRGMGVSARTTGEADTEPRPGFDVPGAGNGRLALTLRNASAGGPVKGARVLGGRFEGRATPIVTTDRLGRASARFAPGRYTLTVQAPGYGIQRVPVTIARGRTTAPVVRLRPNLLSEAAGARVLKVSSQASALPAQSAFDDSEATAWQTAASDAAFDDGPDATAVVRLAKRSTIDTVAVSVMKPPTFPRFAAADKVLVQTSTDGKRWRTVRTAVFRFDGPRPAAPDLALRTFRLRKGVAATHVRAVVASNFGSAAENASTAIVAEVQAFGRVRGLVPVPPKPDAPVTEAGSVEVGNPAQGSLLLPGTEPHRDGVTTASWKTSCPDLPPANGVDAWVTELPVGAGDGKHTITYSGDLALGEFLVYFYDETCTAGSGEFRLLDETTVVPAGAAYAGFLLLYGGGASFDVTVRDTP